jgi:hypothetical protein
VPGKSRSGFPSLLSRHRYSSSLNSPRLAGHAELLHHINHLHSPSVQCFYLIPRADGPCTCVRLQPLLHIHYRSSRQKPGESQVNRQYCRVPDPIRNFQYASRTGYLRSYPEAHRAATV